MTLISKANSRRTSAAFSIRRVLFFSLLLGFLLLVCNLTLHHRQDPRAGPPSSFPILSQNARTRIQQQQQQQESNAKKKQVDGSCRFSVRSVSDLQNCYPSHLVRQLPGEDCGRITDWDEVQHCLNGRFEDAGDSTPANQQQYYDISLIGERNSGTKFVIDELQRCFRNTTNVKIHRDFKRHKHFFQPIYQGDYRKMVVVALFRNPVEWVAAMHRAPYHSPNHLAGFDTTTRNKDGEISAIPLPWQEFVQRPWTTQQQTKYDLEILQDRSRVAETLKGETCLYRFSVYDVVPCVWDRDTQIPEIPDELLRGYVPFYELRRDRSMEPFSNILELRREKHVNFLIEIPMLYRLGGYTAVRYEDLLTDGTRFMLEQVARIVGLDRLPEDCVPTGPQPERLGRRIIPDDFRKWVMEHVDPNLERLLGYYTTTSSTTAQ